MVHNQAGLLPIPHDQLGRTPTLARITLLGERSGRAMTLCKIVSNGANVAAETLRFRPRCVVDIVTSIKLSLCLDFGEPWWTGGSLSLSGWRGSPNDSHT